MSTVKKWISKFKKLLHAPERGAPNVLDRLKLKYNWEPPMMPPKPTICSAAKQGNLEEIKKFLENGTDVNITNPHGETPLHLAVMMNRVECVEFLLTVPDIRIDAESHHGYTPLHLACKMHHGGLEMIERLIEAKADVNICLLENFSPLHSLCETLDTSLVDEYQSKLKQGELLIQNGADLNIRDEINGETAIFVAIEKNAVEMVEMLLHAGAIADIQRYEDYVSPLTLAAQMNRDLIIEILIPFVVDINMGTVDNRTALMLTNTPSITKCLLAAGADPNITAFDCNATAAHLATARHNIHQLKLLYPMTKKDRYSRDYFKDLSNDCRHDDSCPIEILHYLLSYDLNAGREFYDFCSARTALLNAFKMAVVHSKNETIWNICYECILMCLQSINLEEDLAIQWGLLSSFYTANPLHTNESEYNGRIEILVKLCADHGVDINAVNDRREYWRLPLSNSFFELNLRRYLVFWNEEEFQLLYNEHLKNRNPDTPKKWQIIDDIFDEGTLKSHCRRVIRKQLREKDLYFVFVTTQLFVRKVQKLQISMHMKDYILYKFDSRLLTTT